MAEFDEATYSARINWCWFFIRCGDVIAMFRLHMENDESCWTLLETLDGSKLFKDPESTMGFKYGADNGEKNIETRDKMEDDEDGTISARFAWLEEALSLGKEDVHKTTTWLNYHGIEYYSHAADKHA